jgi:hypothetical protein
VTEFAPGDGWISVNDRLPDTEPLEDLPDISLSATVYVLLDTGCGIREVKESACCDGDWLYLLPGENKLVTHWRPAPDFSVEDLL